MLLLCLSVHLRRNETSRWILEQRQLVMKKGRCFTKQCIVWGQDGTLKAWAVFWLLNSSAKCNPSYQRWHRSHGHKESLGSFRDWNNCPQAIVVLSAPLVLGVFTLMHQSQKHCEPKHCSAPLWKAHRVSVHLQCTQLFHWHPQTWDPHQHSWDPPPYSGIVAQSHSHHHYHGMSDSNSSWCGFSCRSGLGQM